MIPDFFELIITNLREADNYMGNISEEIAKAAEYEDIPNLTNNTLSELINEVFKVKEYIEKNK